MFINFHVANATTPTKEVCPLRATFFGLTSRYMDGVYETLFMLKMHGAWGFFEIYALPVRLRNWFVERLTKHFDEINKASTKN